MNVVVDASVAAKWLFLEVDSGKARQLLGAFELGQVEILATGILHAEIANVLWKRMRRGDLDSDLAFTYWQDFRRLNLTIFPVSELASAALRLAIERGHSVYDCLSVALAQQERCALVTADEKLYNAFSPFFPAVRLLRNWS